MDFNDLKNAARYPFSNENDLLLGFVLLLADLVNEFHGTDKLSVIIKLILTIVALLMSVLEAGYLFKVVEETTRGSDSLPKFSDLKEIFIHGTKEIIVYLYSSYSPLLRLL
jgi:hypothetical protein